VIDLINIHSATGKIIIRRKKEGSRRAVVIQNTWFCWPIRVVSKETNLIFFLLGSEKDQSVVDRELGEPNYVYYQRRAIGDFSQELSGQVLLPATAKGKNHPPMAALNIAVPGGPAFGFQQILAGLTKRAQIRVPWNDDFLGIRPGVPRAGGNYSSNETTVSGLIGYRSAGIKPRIEVELARRSRYDKTMLRIAGLGLASMRRPLPLRIVFIGPSQFIGESEGICFKIKRSMGRGIEMVWTGASKKEKEKKEHRGKAHCRR